MRIATGREHDNHRKYIYNLSKNHTNAPIFTAFMWKITKTRLLTAGRQRQIKQYVADSLHYQDLTSQKASAVVRSSWRAWKRESIWGSAGGAKTSARVKSRRQIEPCAHYSRAKLTCSFLSPMVSSPGGGQNSEKQLAASRITTS